MTGVKLARVWSPQPGPQTAAIQARFIDIMLYGGAKYGGKTDFLLGDFLQDVPIYKHHWHGILVRRSMPELAEVVQRSHELFYKTGAIWQEHKKTWRFREGSTLMFRAIEKDQDISKYQGWSKGWIGLDEVGNWVTDQILRRFAIPNRRWGRAKIPHKRIRMTANPHGVGHSWLKKMFIDHNPLGFKPFVDETSNLSCIFIPARIEQNLLGIERDPDYARALQGLGSASLVKAWLEGDWSVISGAYFDNWYTDRHVMKPRELPEHWTRFCSFDWGFSAPFSVGWYAISDGTVPGIAEGAYIKYREWYGADPDGNGLRLTDAEMARGIRAREKDGERIDYRVADPSIFAGSVPTAETMSNEGVTFRPADNKRVPGWQKMRGLLDEAKLIFFDTCVDSIRIIPLIQHDERRPEDLDTRQEDHCVDECRYAITSRGSVTEPPAEKKPIKTLRDYTLDELWELSESIQNNEDRI